MVSQCDDGWVTNSNTYCYYFNTNDTITWTEAKNECALRNAKLLEMETFAEWVSCRLLKFYGEIEF